MRLLSSWRQEHFECSHLNIYAPLDSVPFLYLSYRQEEIARFIHTQSKGIEEFEAEREKLVRGHDEKKAELKRKYLAAEVELEKELDAALTQLMEKYTPRPSEPSAS